MFVVGDDDKKDLLVYRTGQAAVHQTLKISDFPGLRKKVDLEGAARIGDVIYWIGSHSRKNNGDEDLDRHRLFAIKVTTVEGQLVAQAVGKPYEGLLADLAKDERFARFNLAAAAMLAPGAAGGLNIEGLAATKDGGLLIGFRSPVHGGKALIVPLGNPQKILNGEKPSFGDPIELDLGGLGIRSLERWPEADAFLVIAGSVADGGRFQAYRWSGKESDPPQPIADAGLTLLVPEAVFFDPASPSELIILSDDGDACPEPQEAFRSRRVKLPVQ